MKFEKKKWPFPRVEFKEFLQVSPCFLSCERLIGLSVFLKGDSSLVYIIHDLNKCQKVKKEKKKVIER